MKLKLPRKKTLENGWVMVKLSGPGMWEYNPQAARLLLAMRQLDKEVRTRVAKQIQQESR